MTSRKFSIVLTACTILSSSLISLSCASSEKNPHTNYRSVIDETGELTGHENSDDAAIAGPSISQSSTASIFDWPVDEARLTRGYKTTPTGKRRKPHLGIDLAAPKGTPIIAAHSGIVIYAGRDFRGYGRMVMVEGKNGYATLYAHLDRIYVSEGQRIAQGAPIGGMGRTGRASGVHLHFEIRKESGPVDPLEYLPNGQKYAHLLTANQEIKDSFKN